MLQDFCGELWDFLTVKFPHQKCKAGPDRNTKFLASMKLTNLHGHFFCLCFESFARHKRARTSKDSRTVPWFHRPSAPRSVLSPRWPELWKRLFIGEEGKVSDLSVSNSAAGLLRLAGCCSGRTDGAKLPARACRDQHFFTKIAKGWCPF